MAILGIDEVGRGPWAGPLVVGAVVLSGEKIDGLADSKKLSAKKRAGLAQEIRESGARIGLGWVSAKEIDDIGLGAALRLATRRAVEQVKVSYHEIIIDGTVNMLAGTSLEDHVTMLAKADSLISEVSAASIVAKVARDEYMANLANTYPEYGFEKHVGYGTAAHREALHKYGVTPEHRLSFRPVQEISDSLSSGILLRAPKVRKYPTTRQIGDRAEAEVAEHLVRLGHEIVARNWRTKFCEIDIVSRAGEHVYFTEVKYRRDARRGGGLEAVTKEKLCKMKFAAESYMKFSGLNGSPILAVGVASGPDFVVDEWFTV